MIPQKYIVWPTPKAKTDFHRALETAFPVYDPLFPKVLSKEKSRTTEPDSTEKEEVPDSWDERLTDETESITAASDSINVESNKPPATGEIKETSSKQGNTSIPSDLACSSASPDSGDGIVLGPGGQWGLQLERPPLREQLKNSDVITPKVAAWSLPTPQQQWEFSEITHHGRRKQRALNRKK